MKIDKAKLAAKVRQEFLHTWNGYKQYAWGHDDLKPISGGYQDWYDESLLMTAVDALDALILLGFKEEADSNREYIAQNLNFDKDTSVKTFEINIRLLGGLLSSYQMTKDTRLLNLARDLADRLLPTFNLSFTPDSLWIFELPRATNVNFYLSLPISYDFSDRITFVLRPTFGREYTKIRLPMMIIRKINIANQSILTAGEFQRDSKF